MKAVSLFSLLLWSTRSHVAFSFGVGSHHTNNGAVKHGISTARNIVAWSASSSNHDVMRHDIQSPTVSGENAVENKQHHGIMCVGRTLRRAVTSFLLVLALGTTTITTTATTTSSLPSSVAMAADYNSLSGEQKAVAEAWRTVDYSFFDRSFNEQDWFKMRQDAVKKKYRTMDDARVEIAAMVGKLGDKYTRYLPPDKYQSMVNSATGTLAGIGVEIAPKVESEGAVARVMAADVEENSPAQAGGIKPLDVFVEVDGYQCNDDKCTPDTIAERVRGPIGSKVGVVMERDGKRLDFIVTRAAIRVTTVKSYISDTKTATGGKIGVVRIKSFSGTTATTVSDVVTDLKKKGATAFVIDVRNNPGGLLPGGVETASLFLHQNDPVVFVVNKSGVVDAQYVLQNGLDLDDPVVIFVNGNTASASEVFTAAMQENKRATVVGTQTFGKGIVQTIRELSNNNGGVAVTVARYETPLHHDINKQGIPVDIKVETCNSADAASCIPPSAFAKP